MALVRHGSEELPAVGARVICLDLVQCTRSVPTTWKENIGIVADIVPGRGGGGSGVCGVSDIGHVLVRWCGGVVVWCHAVMV